MPPAEKCHQLSARSNNYGGSHLIASSARFATFSFPLCVLRKTSFAAFFLTGRRLGKNGLLVGTGEA
jgi:hypothetical protein